MAISSVASTSANPGANGGATAAITTTGANLLVISVSWYAGTTTALTVSDSKGNTWVPLTLRTTATTAHRFYYATSVPTVGTGHTVTVTATGIYPVIVFHAYAGAHATTPFDVEAGATATSGTSLATGAVSPAAAGSLIVSGWAGMNGTSVPTVDAGLAITTKQTPLGGIALGCGAGVLLQSTAAPAAVAPTWRWTGSDHAATAVAVFKPAVAPVAGAVTLVAALTESLGVSGGTTAALNTTGADLLVLGVAYNQAGTVTVSDSKGNTWTGLTARASTNAAHRFYYAANPIVGTGHTFSVTGALVYVGVVVQAFSGAALTGLVVTENGASGPIAISGAPGAITPAVNNCLILSGLAVEDVTGLRVDTGLQQVTINYRTALSLTAATGWITQAVAAAIAPAWTWALGSTWAGSVVAFSPAAPAAVARADTFVWGPL